MKKLLLILLCVPLMFSCGDKENDNTENTEEETNNKELKPIEMNDQCIIQLTDLQKNKEFRRILSKTYKL